MGLKWFRAMSKAKGEKSNSSSSSAAQPWSPSGGPPAGVCLRQLFDHFDADGDGMISASDIEASLGRVGGLSQDRATGDAASMLWAADLDGDGYISLEEFAAVCGAGGDEAPARREEELRSAFEVYDRNGDGVISAEELYQVLCVVMGKGAATLEECRGMIRAVDCDGDGAVDFEEFSRMMAPQPSLAL